MTKRVRRTTQKHEIISAIVKETGIKKCRRPRLDYFTRAQLVELLSFAKLRNEEVFNSRKQRLTSNGTEEN